LGFFVVVHERKAKDGIVLGEKKMKDVINVPLSTINKTLIN